MAEDPGHRSIADQHEDRLFGWACNVARIFPVFNPALQRTIMRWYPGRQRCDRSYRVFPSARTVRFNEMEYEVPVGGGVSCFREVVALLRKQRLTDCFPVEFRRVKRDSYGSVHSTNVIVFPFLFINIFGSLRSVVSFGRAAVLEIRRQTALGKAAYVDGVATRKAVSALEGFLSPSRAVGSGAKIREFVRRAVVGRPKTLGRMGEFSTD